MKRKLEIKVMNRKTPTALDHTLGPYWRGSVRSDRSCKKEYVYQFDIVSDVSVDRGLIREPNNAFVQMCLLFLDVENILSS